MRTTVKTRKLLAGTIGLPLFMLLCTVTGVRAQWTTNGNNTTTTNNVGIGTTSPPDVLSLRSSSNGAAVNVSIDGWTNGERGLLIRSNVGSTPYTRWKIGSPATSGGEPGGDVGTDFGIERFNDSGSSLGLSLFIQRGSGNVGIGTNNPQRSLQITGSNAVGILDANSQYELYMNQSSSYARIGPTYRSGGAFVPLTFWTGDTERVRVDTSGNVGVGTTNPLFPLHVSRSAADQYLGWFENTQSSPGVARLRVQNTATQGSFEVDVLSDGTTYFQTGKSSNTPNLSILSGNVGIGTTSPGYKLDVNGNTNISGNITASGTINAKYQDVAEWVPSSEQLSPGTVVVLDSTKSNQVTSSSVSYDTRVAGVVSEQPGIALGEKSDTKVLVATTGRVKVKVDASKGAIHIGDLLVTSDIPGVAMRSAPVEFAGRKMHMPGTLIGKALEPLEKGTGTILVLLSLQ